MRDHDLDTKEQSSEYVAYMQKSVLALRPAEFARVMTLRTDGYNTIKQWSTSGLSLVKPDRVAIACLCTFEAWREYSPHTLKHYIQDTIELVDSNAHPGGQLNCRETAREHLNKLITRMGISKVTWSQLMMNKRNGYDTAKQWLARSDSLRMPHAPALAHASALASWHKQAPDTFNAHVTSIVSLSKQQDVTANASKAKHQTYIKALTSSGTDVEQFTCPHCHTEMHTQVNYTSRDWDVISVCFECTQPYQKITLARKGQVITRRVNE